MARCSLWLVLMPLLFASGAKEQRASGPWRWREEPVPARCSEPVVQWLWSGPATVCPTAAITPEAVRFLDERGELRKVMMRPRGSSVLTEAESGLLGVMHTHGPPEKPVTRVQVYDARGQERGSYETQGKLAEQYPGAVLVGSEGVVFGWAADARIEFHTARGGRRTVNLFPDAPLCQERPLAMATDAHGSCVAVVTQCYVQAGHGLADTNHATAVVFSPEGQEKWRRPLAGEMAASIAVAPWGALIVASSYTWQSHHTRLLRFTEVFDVKGERLGTFPLLMRKVLFSSDRRRLLLAEKRSLSFLSLGSGGIQWTWNELPSAEHFVAAVAATASLDTCAVVAATARLKDAHFVHADMEMAILDHRGEVLDRHTFSGQEALVPVVHATRDLKTIAVGFSNHYVVLRRCDE